MTEINCPQCGARIELDAVLEKDIEARVVAAEHERHQAELDRVRSEATSDAAREMAAKLELAEARRRQDVELAQQKSQAERELAEEKLRADLEADKQKQLALQESQLRKLTEQAERAGVEAQNEAQEKKELRQQLTAMTEELRATRRAKDEADLLAAQKIATEETRIREESRKSADEEHRLRQAELEKKLADTQKALDDARRKAEQGSQQNQGEVLELDLETELRAAFPADEITEVKKGQRGADIRQVVRNARMADTGILLWESKNARWQAAWTAKFKQDIREANADIGILVSAELPDTLRETGFGLVDEVWVAKPHLALTLAAALRSQIIAVHQANTAASAKDERMEVLYQFLIGPEFRHRIESIVESYGLLQREIEKEKRAAALRWAKQEKAIRVVIDSTIGMYGDLQGIAGAAMDDILELENSTDDD